MQGKLGRSFLFLCTSFYTGFPFLMVKKNGVIEGVPASIPSSRNCCSGGERYGGSSQVECTTFRMFCVAQAQLDRKEAGEERIMNREPEAACFLAFRLCGRHT